jgi:parvulin-like peptidyl-prolyl isomerase
MKVGDTSGVIESSFGFHIIKLTGKEPSRSISLEEVKSDILNNLLKAKTQELLQEHLSRLRKKSDIKIFI